MNYNLERILERFDAGEVLKYLFFWGHTSTNAMPNKTCFSQWYPARFVVNGVSYASTEHWMMAKKAALFNDAEMVEKIITCAKPAQAKALGRKVRNFNSVQWNAYKYAIVVIGNVYKFSQHTELKTFLLNTQQRILVEASPRDKIWGIGMSEHHKDVENPFMWRGDNLLGFALMEAREILRKNTLLRTNDMLAPWEKYPHWEAENVAWQKGVGKDYLQQFKNYWARLSVWERRWYCVTHLQVGAWHNWYTL